MFLWIEQQRIPVGVLAMPDASHPMYRFRYGKRYLEHPKAYALNPLHLELVDREFESERLPYTFSDSVPDEWGKKLFTLQHGFVPDNEASYLCKGQMQVGAMTFGDSLTPQPLMPPATFSDIDEIYDLYQRIEAKKPVPAELQSLFIQGSGLGGARPKATLMDDAQEWIIKFPMKNDIFDNCLAEHLAMSVAKSANINSAETKLIAGKFGNAVAIKRFDRLNGQGIHYQSAMAMLGSQRIPVSQVTNTFSYHGIANLMSRFTENPACERLELFRRAAFNIAIGNLDDHLKNHGFIYQSRDLYALSPAFDIVQHPDKSMHAIATGKQGPQRDFNNLLSEAYAFGLHESEAKDIINDVYDVVQTDYVRQLNQHDMPQSDIKLLKAHLIKQHLV